MGRQSYIAFVALALVQAATAGFPGALTRYIGELLGARRGDHAMALYRFTRRVEIVAAALVLAVLLIVAALGGPSRGAAWALAGLSGALAVLQAVPMSLLAGAQRWRAGLVARARHRHRHRAGDDHRARGRRRDHRAVRGRGRGGVREPAVDLRAGAAARGARCPRRRRCRRELRRTVPVVRGLDDDHHPDPLRRLAAVGAVHHAALLDRRRDRVLLDRVRRRLRAVRSCRRRSRWWRSRRSRTSSAPARTNGSGAASGARCGCWCWRRCRSSRAPRWSGRRCSTMLYGAEFADTGTVLLVMLAPLLVQPMLRVSEGVLYGLERVRFIVGRRAGGDGRRHRARVRADPEPRRRRRGDRQRRGDPRRGRAVPRAGGAAAPARCDLPAGPAPAHGAPRPGRRGRGRRGAARARDRHRSPHCSA